MILPAGTRTCANETSAPCVPSCIGYARRDTPGAFASTRNSVIPSTSRRAPPVRAETMNISAAPPPITMLFSPSRI